MKIFLDTAGIDEIHTAARWGVLDGVTTNPTLFAKVGGSYDDVLKQICEITPGPVSAEVVAEDVDGMLREGRHFATLAPNIVVKVPMSEEGLEAIARLAAGGYQDQLHADLQRQPGAARGEGRSLAAVALRRPPRRHQSGRHGRRARTRRDGRDLRPRRRGAGCVDPAARVT